MSDDRTPDERAAAALQYIADLELAELLADVRRIAEGVGAIHELALTLAPAVAITRAGTPVVGTTGRLAELRRLHDEALAGGETCVTVPGPLLSMVLQLIDQHVRRG